jgi:hypothetical protein
MNASLGLNPTALEPVHGSRQAQGSVLRKLISLILHKIFTFVHTDKRFKLNKTGYALIDLGTNIVPAAMNNSNVVVGGGQMWSAGTNSTLPADASGTYYQQATGIDDAGHMVGWNLGNSSGAYWANKDTTASQLGNSFPWGGGSYGVGVLAPLYMGGDGTIIGQIFGGLTYSAALATFSTGGTCSYLWIPGGDVYPPGATSQAYPASKARGHWAGNYTTGGTPVTWGAVMDSTQYDSKTAYGVNDSGVLVGQDNSGHAIIIAGTGSGTLGTGMATALNNATVLSGTNTVTQPQIVGADGSGNPTLWDYTNPDGSAATSYVAKNLNKLISSSSGWAVTAPTTNSIIPLSHPLIINNGGSIAATANYSGTNYPTGQHGVVLVSTKVTWETIGSNTTVDDNNDPVTGLPMSGGGKRIFPDKINPTDTGTGRNKVTLRVNAGIGAAGWKVYVQAFDIDDPTPDSVDIDSYGDHHIIDSNDTATVKKGNDNLSDPEGTQQTGFFTHSGTASDNATLDSTGKADFEFNVGYQPGNNYRVAVTFLNSSELSNLQVTDSTQPCYVPPEYNKYSSGFSGILSPPLTVWRRLWIEQDSMAAVPTSGSQANFRAGNITAITTNSPVSGQSTLTTDTVFGDDVNRFEHGTITINGVNYPVIGNTGNYLSHDQVVITGTPTSGAVVEKSFTIVDDDEDFLPTGWSPLMPRFGLVTNSLISKYSPAYILVVDAASYNTHTTVPFVLNEDESTYFSFYSNYNDVRQSKDLITSATCWSHLLVACYQPGTIEDDDPNTELPSSGVTVPSFLLEKFSLVFLETIRDREDFNLRNPITRSLAQADFLNQVTNVMAHEIGHTPGNQTPKQDHNELGLMGDGATVGPNFLAPTILRFRKSHTWNGD